MKTVFNCNLDRSAPLDSALFCASINRIAYTSAAGFATLFLTAALFWK